MEVQIMAKTSKSTASTATKQPPRKAGPKSATRRQTQRPTAAATAPANTDTAAAAASVRQSKKASILALLERPDGAAIGDLTAATGWQVHSVRAALTGLRKEGKELVRAKDAAGVTHYRVAAEA
jgi:hypothetical protein